MTDERVERRLAAILAADVVGYSRLMGVDDVMTLRALKTHRREVVDPAITAHHGRIVKTTGDGMLVEFASAVDAVNCAMEMQKSMADRSDANATNVNDKLRIVFRIGINVGDIIIDGDDIFGDGVNVAARVEAECEPGGVYLSANAFEQIRSKTSFKFDDMGERQLKNIDRPVRVYSVHTGQPKVATQSGEPPTISSLQDVGKPPPLPDKPSIAVLPFQNMSGDPEQEYFADGMVEDIITALSRFKSLFVIARNSSFTYKGRPVDIKQVGRELGVRYVLEGSVRKAGGRVRITGQLIEAATGTHLWADKFDGALEEVFDLQDSVTECVVAIIVPKVRNAEIDRLERKRPDNLDGYDSVLRAQGLLGKGTIHDIPEAISHLERAIESIPNYALAHALIASCYARLYIAGANTDLEAERRKAVNFAHRGIELGSDDPETLAYAALALGNFEDWDGPQLAERAVSLNPNLAMGWFLLGAGKLYRGDYEQALECQARSLRLSPIGSNRVGTMASTALAYLLSDRYEQAYSWAERAYAENSDHPFALRVFAMSAALAGKRTQAHMAFQRFAPTAPKFLERTKGLMRNSKDFEKIVEAMRLASTPE